MSFVPLEVLETHAARMAAYSRLVRARQKHWGEGDERSKAQGIIAEIEWDEAFEAHRQAIIRSRSQS